MDSNHKREIEVWDIGPPNSPPSPLFKDNMKFVLLLLVLACSKETTEHTANYILPAGLEDCRIYKLYDGYSSLKVIRCPKSETGVSWTTSSGKSTTTHYTSVISE
jgi:hypothetical protein